MVSRKFVAFLLIFAVLVAACGPSATATPTAQPPTEEPTAEPTATAEPTEEPTAEPTATTEPTEEPTEEPTAEPTATTEPTEEPTAEPTATEEPTEEPSATPLPTEAPTQESVVEALTNAVVVTAGNEVVLGFSAALSGDVAVHGINIQRGAELALEDRPTVTVGGQEFPVRLDVQDDLCSAEGGQAVANRFVSNPDVVAVVGLMCSSGCRSAMPVFDDAGFTTISPSCTQADLTTGGSTSFNRAIVSDAFQGVIVAEYIYNELGVRRVATIHDGSPYGEGLVAVMSERFEELGGEIVASDAVTVGDTDFRGLLDDIANEDPELIYFGGFNAEGARLAIQRADAGLDDVIFMGADGIRSTEFVTLAGSAGEGTYASNSIPAQSEALDAFLARYVEKYGEEPPSSFHTNAYDAVNVLLDAIEAVGVIDEDGNLVISRDAIREYVRSVTDFQGLTGELNADGTGELAVSDIGIYQVQNGEFVLVAVGRVVDGEVVIEPPPVPAEEPTAEPTEEVTEEPAEEATEEATPEAEATQSS